MENRGNFIWIKKKTKKKANSFEVKCGEITVTKVNTVKYLGLQIDNNLSGTSVIEDFIKKSNTRIRMLYRYNDMLNLEMR